MQTIAYFLEHKTVFLQSPASLPYLRAERFAPIKEISDAFEAC